MEGTHVQHLRKGSSFPGSICCNFEPRSQTAENEELLYSPPGTSRLPVYWPAASIVSPRLVLLGMALGTRTYP